MEDRQHKAEEKRLPVGQARWPAVGVVLVALALYSILPTKLILGPRLLIPMLETVLLVVLAVLNPDRRAAEELHVRGVAVALIALINIANLASVILLVDGIVAGAPSLTGKTLLYSALSIWTTNVLVFGLWFWEVDKGGPRRRREDQGGFPDFLFPQSVSPELTSPTWRPSLVDYLYVALTNATAFSPTDTMPLSVPAKVLMTLESLTSMITVIMVAARAVNILH